MTRVFDEDLIPGFGTRAIHAGQRPEPLAGAIMTPVYLTSTYVQEGLGQNKGYEYARGKNPTREAFERNVAALENGRHGFAFASGMACLDSIMKLLRAGDHVICAENVYGGTFRLFDKILQNFGLSFSFIDTRDPQRVADAVTPKTRAILVETPSNPLMRRTDIAAVAEIARRAGALLIVDNTLKCAASNTDCTGTPICFARLINLPDNALKGSNSVSSCDFAAPLYFFLGNCWAGASSSNSAKYAFAAGSPSTRCSCAMKSRYVQSTFTASTSSPLKSRSYRL